MRARAHHEPRGVDTVAVENLENLVGVGRRTVVEGEVHRLFVGLGVVAVVAVARRRAVRLASRGGKRPGGGLDGRHVPIGSPAALAVESALRGDLRTCRRGVARTLTGRGNRNAQHDDHGEHGDERHEREGELALGPLLRSGSLPHGMRGPRGCAVVGTWRVRLLGTPARAVLRGALVCAVFVGAFASPVIWMIAAVAVHVLASFVFLAVRPVPSGRRREHYHPQHAVAVEISRLFT